VRAQAARSLLAVPLLALLGCVSTQRLPDQEADALATRRAAVFVGADSVALKVGPKSFDYQAEFTRNTALSLGTAFAVTPDGHLLSAAHIFDRSGGTICVYLFASDGQAGEFLPAELVHRDAASDLAVLKVAAATPRAFELGGAEPAIGTRVVSTGMTRGSQRGELFKVSATKGARPRLEFARDANVGDSGGAVLDPAGSAVGVIVEGGFLWHGPRLERVGIASTVDSAWWAAVRTEFARDQRYRAASEAAGACTLDASSGDTKER
jgi:S1-C subfamily serine protease